MTIFERMFPRPKDMSGELEKNGFEEKVPEQKPETPKPVRTKKTLEEIQQATGELQDLTSKRWDTNHKHRDTVEELRRLGVNETDFRKPLVTDSETDKVFQTKPRTETVKDILGPIEDELVALSTEITNKREEFDLQPNRQEVIDRRQHRLVELKHRLIDQFNKTPSGNKIKYIDAQIAQFHHNADIYQSKIQELVQEKESFFQTDAVAHKYHTTLERIDRLNAVLDTTIADSKRVQTPKNKLELQ